MKKIALVILLSFNVCFGQTFTLKDLFTFQKLSISEITDRLILKKWELQKSEQKGEFSDFDGKTWVGSEVSWLFKNSKNSHVPLIEYTEFSDFDLPLNEGKTELIEMESIKRVSLAYWTPDVNVYTSIKQELLALGFKKTDEKLAGTAIQSVYETAKYSVKLSVGKKGGTQVYVIHVLNKIPYEKL